MNDKRKYLCAVSGGPDSMALLDKYHNQISLVCHVNYQVRESALRDTNIVIAYCKEKNIKLEILTVTEQMYDEYRKICNNFEAIARFIRYDFFLKCSKKHHLNTILIAHNLDDFLETAIMQKQKNSKTLFYGIKKRTQYHGLNIFRPLLNVRKKDLEKYCLTNHIPYGIDETNFCDKYTRNKIRLEIKTWQTKKFNDTIKEYKKFNEENKNKDKLIQEIYTEWENKDYDCKLLVHHQPHVLYYVIYNFLSKNNIKKISSDKISNIIDFIIKGKGNSEIRLGGNIFLQKQKNRIKILNQSL